MPDANVVKWIREKYAALIGDLDERGRRRWAVFGHSLEMPDANVVKWIREKYTALIGDLDERGRRRWAASEACSLGRGGIAAVAEAEVDPNFRTTD